MTRPRHTVLYTHGGGRLGNQLLRFLHWAAWAREHEGIVEVINLGFWPYAELFSPWLECPGCVYPVRPHLLDMVARKWRRLPRPFLTYTAWRMQRLGHAVGHFWPGSQAIALNDRLGEAIDLEQPEFFSRIESRRLTTCAGWKISGWNFLARHQAALCDFFRPAAEFDRRASDFMGPLRQQHDVVAGVFIRQGDYREWHDGRFCFSSASYAGWIRQLLDLHPGKRLAVVIASDQPQDRAVFAGLPCHFASGSVNRGGHWFESFVELSRCDFVLSPPSTFGATAAFLGSVPLWPLLAPGQTLAFNQIMADALTDAAAHPVFGLSVK